MITLIETHDGYLLYQFYQWYRVARPPIGWVSPVFDTKQEAQAFIRGEIE